MGEGAFVKSFIEQLNQNQRLIAKEFDRVSKDMNYLHNLVKKNKRKIRGLRCALLAMGIGLLIEASELAERKRSENYLNDRIDQLEARLEGNTNDGGEADA